MKKVTTYGPMKGVLKLEAGQVVFMNKKSGEEIAYDYKEILEMLADEEVTISIKHHETIDED